MKNHTGIKIVYYRTLYSQSAASVSAGRLAAYLQQNGILVRLTLLKRTRYGRNELQTARDFLDDYDKFPIIFAKPNFKDHEQLFPLLKNTKEQQYIKKVFLFGPFASANALSILQENSWIDGVIYGYPEDTALEIAQCIQNNQSYYMVTGGMWRDSITGEIYDTFYRVKVTPFEKLPWPLRDIEKNEPVNYINIEGSRGCLFNCSYCHVRPFQKEGGVAIMQVRTAKDIVDEIEYLHRTLRKTLFIFNDSIFWMHHKDDERILEFCNEIIKRKLNIRFYIYLRVKPFPDEKIIQKLADVGLARVFLGVENASDSVLTSYAKGSHAQDEFIKVKKIFQKYNVNIHIGFIMFSPLSTIVDIEKNVQYLHFIKKLVRIGIILEPVRVIPNSGMHHLLEKEKLIHKGINYRTLTWGYDYKHPEVGKLLKELDLFFRKNMNDLSYDLEYYCVSGTLLIDLARKYDTEKIKKIRDEVQNFLEIYDRCNNLMREFLITSIKKIKNANYVDEISNPEKNKAFIKEYADETLNLQIAWGALSEAVRRSYGEIPLREVFQGVE